VSTQEHAEDIRRHLRRDDALARRYATAAAKWSWVRLKRRREEASVADERQYELLTERLRKLSLEMGLETCDGTENPVGRIGLRGIPVEPVVGVTDALGYLPAERSELLGETWFEAVEAWHDLCDWQHAE
jgi:hypothetical protein